MAQADFWSLDGGTLHIEGGDVEQWPVVASACHVSGWPGDAALSTAAAHALFVQVRHFEGMQFTEEYSLAGGNAGLAEGGVYDTFDFKYLGLQHALLWDCGRSGLLLDAADKGRDWLLQFADRILVESNDWSVRLSPRERDDWRFIELARGDSARLRVTVPDVGTLHLLTEDEGNYFKQKAEKSTSLRSGRVYTRFGSGSREVVLAASGADILVSVTEGPPQEGVDRLAELASVAWSNT